VSATLGNDNKKSGADSEAAREREIEARANHPLRTIENHRLSALRQVQLLLATRAYAKPL
jgi:hypothetical protein